MIEQHEPVVVDGQGSGSLHGSIRTYADRGTTAYRSSDPTEIAQRRLHPDYAQEALLDDDRAVQDVSRRMLGTGELDDAMGRPDSLRCVPWSSR